MDDPEAMVTGLTCPTCYAIRASEQLRALLDEEAPSQVPPEGRAGMGRGHVGVLADATWGWRFCAAHEPPAPRLTGISGAPTMQPLDCADVRGELEIRIAQLEERAQHADSLGATEAAGGLRGRALRIKELLAFFVALLLCACDAWPLGAPPYRVCLEASVPEADREVWRAAEDRWNVEIGAAVLLDDTRDCEVSVRESTELSEPACTLAADEQVRIFYVPAELEPCVALHELAHLLLGPGRHVPGTVLDEYGCDYANVTAPVADLVREKWGL